MLHSIQWFKIHLYNYLWTWTCPRWCFGLCSLVGSGPPVRRWSSCRCTGTLSPANQFWAERVTKMNPGTASMLMFSHHNFNIISSYICSWHTTAQCIPYFKKFMSKLGTLHIPPPYPPSSCSTPCLGACSQNGFPILDEQRQQRRKASTPSKLLASPCQLKKFCSLKFRTSLGTTATAKENKENHSRCWLMFHSLSQKKGLGKYDGRACPFIVFSHSLFGLCSTSSF